MTISASGWSTFTSMSGGKAKIPLFAAFSWSCFAKLRISEASAVEAMTNSTGKFPPPGSAGGRMGKVWIPGTAPTFCWTSGRIWAAVRFRSFQGLSPSPQNPPDGKVIWKVKLVSGIPISIRFTSRVDWADLVEGGVGRGVHDPEDHALVLDRGQLARATGGTWPRRAARSRPTRCR